MPKRKVDFTKEEAIEQLRLLKQHPGWLIVVKALDANIQDTETQIEKAAELEDPIKYNVVMKELQTKKSDRKNLKELPDTIIGELKSVETVPEELDPYA